MKPGVPAVQSPNNIAKQLIEILESNPKELENLIFGSISLEIRNGTVYKMLVSQSILVKNEARDALK